MTDISFDDLSDDALDAPLPTFAILARFREEAATEAEAIDALSRRFVEAGAPAATVSTERRDDDSTWLLVARVVSISIDASTAVAGVVEDLASAGLRPDEVWVHRQIA
ncbi:MAG TPA: hypothetical protein VNB94_08370 [Mycobacteriales bacterium]|nr:hypothetical protein [Mycobacteriales bacterium]